MGEFYRVFVVPMEGNLLRETVGLNRDERSERVRNGGFATVFADEEIGDAGRTELFHRLYGAEVEGKGIDGWFGQTVSIEETPDLEGPAGGSAVIGRQPFSGEAAYRGKIAEVLVEDGQAETFESTQIGGQKILFYPDDLVFLKGFPLTMEEEGGNVKHGGGKPRIPTEEVAHEETVSAADFQDGSNPFHRQAVCEEVVKDGAVGVVLFQYGAARAFRRLKHVANRELPPERFHRTAVVIGRGMKGGFHRFSLSQVVKTVKSPVGDIYGLTGICRRCMGNRPLRVETNKGWILIMKNSIDDLNLSPRILLGPGPSAVHPRVLRTMSTPLIGYLDPEWLVLMEEEQQLLRSLFLTDNRVTLPMSGTGGAGMETALCNFLEPGDAIIVGCNGFFSERMCDIATRLGARVFRLERPYGEVFEPDEIDAALRKAGPVKMVALVHAETSTGALQPMEGIGEIAHRHGAMMMMDCVTSLGGVPVRIDEWNVDVAYSGTQKCIGCPPGIAPFTAGERAMGVLHSRKAPVPNWYLDLKMIEQYWGQDRAYHHTPAASLHYAFRESLRMILEEGLEARWGRHRANAELLWEGLEKLGLKMHVAYEHRLPSLTTVCIPQGVDDLKVRTVLREDYNIEIAGGFGPLKGKTWRVGLMGYSSRKENVALLLAALREILCR